MSSAGVCELSTIEHDRVLVVTVRNSPDNAITPEILDGLTVAYYRLTTEPQLAAMIVQGGGDVFSKGYDVARIAAHASPAEHRDSLLLGNDLCSLLADSPKPVVAAINGHCLGAGLELALACQFRLCVDKARLGLPELSRGVLPGLGGIPRAVRLLGRPRALELIVAGVLLSAEEAHAWGLVHRILPRQGFQDGVHSFVRGLLAVDQGLVREALRLTAYAVDHGDQNCVLETVESIVRLPRGAIH